MNTDIRQRLKSIYDTLTRHFKYRGSESLPVYLTYWEPTGRQPPPLCRGSTWWRWNWIFLTVAPRRLKSTFTPPVTPETFVYFPPGPFTGSVRNGFTAEFNSNMYFDVIIFSPCIISTHVRTSSPKTIYCGHAALLQLAQWVALLHEQYCTMLSFCHIFCMKTTTKHRCSTSTSRTFEH